MNEKHLWFVQFSNNRKHWLLWDFCGYLAKADAERAVNRHRSGQHPNIHWRVRKFVDPAQLKAKS